LAVAGDAHAGGVAGSTGEEWRARTGVDAMLLRSSRGEVPGHAGIAGCFFPRIGGTIATVGSSGCSSRISNGWLIPVMITAVFYGTLAVFSKGSVLAPLLYTLF
jgi:Family of unknown function (DUF5989)